MFFGNCRHSVIAPKNPISKVSRHTSHFFLNNFDKMAILGLHISRILHENNFWTKKRLFFEGLLNYWLSVGWFDFSKKGASLRKKVNAFWKFGVDFWKFGVLTKTRKGAKLAQKTCTKVGRVCKTSSFAARFFIGQRLPKARKRPFFTPECFAAVKQFFCEIFWHFCKIFLTL